MGPRYTKSIPEFVYFSGDGDGWIQGPWVKPQYKSNRKFRLVEIIEGEEKPVINIFVITISTEDGENYIYLYNVKPSVKQIKENFFAETKDNYRKSDWGNTITYSIEEQKVK